MRRAVDIADGFDSIVVDMIHYSRKCLITIEIVFLSITWGLEMRRWRNSRQLELRFSQAVVVCLAMVVDR